jgi:hypothetical protein
MSDIPWLPSHISVDASGMFIDARTGGEVDSEDGMGAIIDALQLALKDALDTLQRMTEQEYVGTDVYDSKMARIAELRAKFLGGK